MQRRQPRLEYPEANGKIQKDVIDVRTTRRTNSTKQKNFTYGRATRALQSVRSRWKEMKPVLRLCCTIALVIVILNICTDVVDFIGTRQDQDRLRGALTTSTVSYSVVINTYKRPAFLAEGVIHYADTCGRKYGVSEVFVLWADLDTLAPTAESFFRSRVRRGESTNFRNGRSRSSVTVIQQKSNSLNSRFLPVNGLDGPAVFMVDDDTRVSCSDLLNGFQAWNNFPDSIVGYHPRLAAPSRRSGKSVTYYSWPTVFWRQQFNMILTKCSFIHEKYLRLYSSETHPRDILDYVDLNHNCEDVAMAMLVANTTKDENGNPAFPIYVEGHVVDKGLFSGISTQTGHMASRSACVTELAQIYVNHGWGNPLARAVSLPDNSWVRHSPGFWWQLKPCTIWEWFALGNVLS